MVCGVRINYPIITHYLPSMGKFPFIHSVVRDFPEELQLQSKLGKKWIDVKSPAKMLYNSCLFLIIKLLFMYGLTKQSSISG